jgi:hypothetical protein
MVLSRLYGILLFQDMRSLYGRGAIACLTPEAIAAGLLAFCPVVAGCLAPDAIAAAQR